VAWVASFAFSTMPSRHSTERGSAGSTATNTPADRL
jgi:hypothetical protein